MRHVFLRRPITAGAQGMAKAPRPARLVAPAGRLQGRVSGAPCARTRAVPLTPVTAAAYEDLRTAARAQEKSGGRLQRALPDARVWLDTVHPEWHTDPALIREMAQFRSHRQVRIGTAPALLQVVLVPPPLRVVIPSATPERIPNSRANRCCSECADSLFRILLSKETAGRKERYGLTALRMNRPCRAENLS
jgi:hypothetical protein